MDERTNGWMGGWMNEGMNERQKKNYEYVN